MKTARGRRVLSVCRFLAIFVPFCASAATTLVPTGALWRYHDDPAAPAADWYRRDFNDATWQSGPAQLGYGGGDEATVITSSTSRPITTYFRHTFVITQSGFFNNLTLRLLRDDGAIVYLNDVEIYRSNMPDGMVHEGTPAVLAVGGGEENRFFQFGVWPYYLEQGSNTIAVEVHQAPGAIDDCSFDLTLVGDLPLDPPTAEILSPESGDVFPSNDVYISAVSSDTDGHIYQMDFYAGTNHIGTDNTEPYEMVWRNFPQGRYKLVAYAIDNTGRRGASAPVHIQVGAGFVPRLLRGPFLQSGTPTNIVVRWRTDWFESSRVVYGTNAALLDRTASQSTPTIEHALRLPGLTPDTTYYYSIRDASDFVLAGGPDFFFRTAPITNRPVRIWAIGDSGTFGYYDTSAFPVRDAYMNYTTNRHTDVWLMLGDNAYESGTDDEYQRGVFETYPQLLRQVVLWPTLGNHDAGARGFPGEYPYFDIFTLPTKGEAGGVPSGTEKYYSFDYADIHFVCLDSQSSSRLAGSPMLCWLETDLAMTSKNWIIAFWHHPPYSWGTHTSDGEFDMIEMREQVVPILERYGVDLNLCGHSHNYERSYLINGHYGYSSDLEEQMILDGGHGHESVDRPYRKPAGGLGANQGSVFAVCGCSGQGGFFQIARHPVMRVATTGYGSMVIDIDGDRLDAKFLRHTGQVDDQFAIVKSANPTGVRPALQITRTETSARLRWPTSRLPFELEAAPAPAENWSEIFDEPATIGRWHHLDVDLNATNRVFRLRGDN
jgi:hypothetical protein